MTNQSWNHLTEQAFRVHFYEALDRVDKNSFDFVTGPGRSGAVASVYASHYLGLPFIPHKAGDYITFESVLVVDTVEYTGRTLRKASKWYQKRGLSVKTVFGFKEHRGHYYKLWYEGEET